MARHMKIVYSLQHCHWPDTGLILTDLSKKVTDPADLIVKIKPLATDLSAHLEETGMQVGRQ